MPTISFYTSLLSPVWLLVSSILLLTLGLWRVTRALRTDPLSRLLITVAASMYAIFLLQFASYHAGIPQYVVFAVYLAGVIASLIAVRSDFARESKLAFPWPALLTWMAVALWLIGLQALIVSYGGSFRYGDWYEHYERSIFYLERWPESSRFLKGIWTLPARGPLFNTSAAFLMTGGSEFLHFQIASTILNSFAVLPLALLLRDVAGFSEKKSLLWSALICALAPYAVTEETYTWNKFFTHGFILTAIYFYRKGLIENNPKIVLVAFLFFAEAILAHYLALLFVIFFAAHFLFTVVQRGWARSWILKTAAASFLLMSPWFIYIFAVFGLKSSVTATSTFGSYVQIQAGEQGEIPPWRLVFLGNLITTSIPYSWRHEIEGLGQAPRMLQMDRRFDEPFRPEESNRVTEWFSDLVNNVDTFPGALGWAGSIGLLIAGTLLFRNRQRVAEKASPPGMLFWSLFFLLGIPLNILASRDYSFHGVGHLNLQTFVSLSAVFVLKVHRHSRRALRWALLGVFLVESTLVTGAYMALQQRTVPIHLNAQGDIVATGVVDVHYKYLNNYIYKLQEQAAFLSDTLGALRLPFLLLCAVLALLFMATILLPKRAHS